LRKGFIYKIVIKDKVYIGQTIDITKRISQHKNSLLNNKHRNKYLQNYYNKYGAEEFKWNIIEECNESELDDRERFWINHYSSNNRKFGFNMDSGGKSNKTVSQETKKLMSKIRKNLYINPEKNPFYGKKHSDETRTRIGEKQKLRYQTNKHPRTNLNENDVYNIKKMLYERKDLTCKEIAKKLNVSYYIVLDIKRCKNWSYVCSDLNPYILNRENIYFDRFIDRNNQIYEMYINGYKNIDISRKLGLSPSRVCQVLNKYKKYNTK